MNHKELIVECKKLGMKGYSKMKKGQLETLVHLKQSEVWFNNILDNGVIVINDASYSDLSCCDISLNDIIELKEKEVKEKPKKTKKKKTNI